VKKRGRKGRTLLRLRQPLEPVPLLRRNRHPRIIVSIVDDRHIWQEVRKPLHQRLHPLRPVMIPQRSLPDHPPSLNPDRPGRIERDGSVLDAFAEGRGLEGAVHEEVFLDQVEFVDEKDFVRFREGVPALSRYHQHRGRREAREKGKTHHRSNPFGGFLPCLRLYSLTASANVLLCLALSASQSCFAFFINAGIGCGFPSSRSILLSILTGGRSFGSRVLREPEEVEPLFFDERRFPDPPTAPAGPPPPSKFPARTSCAPPEPALHRIASAARCGMYGPTAPCTRSLTD
jgi:hypothetical protein